MARYWTGDPPLKDDFNIPITNEFVDGMTRRGPWAFMTPSSFRKNGVGLGPGRGQRYEKQADGKWLKVEG